jgi:flagellar basal-body rod protein FlgB
MTEPVVDTIHAALRGLSLRQRVTADNIANVQTPGFLAGRVSFESELADALAVGRPDDATVHGARSTAPTRHDGNNVNLDEETLTLVKNNLQYQTMVEAMNAKFRLLRTAIRGGA